MIKQKEAIALHAAHGAYSLAVLAGFFLPLFLPKSGLVDLARLPFALYGGPSPRVLPLALAALAAYGPVLLALLKLASPFLDETLPALCDPRRSFSAWSGAAQSGLSIGAVAAHVIAMAGSRRFFAAASPLAYALLALSVAFNAFCLYRIVAELNRRDPSYEEYTRFRRADGAKVGIRDILLKQGIQKRLLLSFVPLVLAIILSLSFVLLRDFGATILGSVIQNGQLLAERTASVIKANPADSIAADDFLAIEAKKNARAAFPFRSISYYARKAKAGSFALASATDRKLAQAKVEQPPFDEPYYSFDAATGLYSFRAPVTLAKSFLGFVQVDYERDVIFESFFRTQVKVIVVASVFVYLSIFLVYLVGRNIAFPILYLRVGVATISSTLSSMIRGETRISSELLQYRDRVTTKDEIKGLSTEVGNMTAVIRGIVPYISASTLKHSERSAPTTESRDLCFLFTDIRGFTTLSEGMRPEQVVEMLNHYLDIQSSIILENHGDVDKFVGDEVMAMFEGPDKELNACKAGMAIRAAMAREKEIALAAKRDVVSIGIGINAGPVVFGSVGAKDRMDFTSIGDTVNLAARLEGANKPYGTKTLITEAVYAKVREAYLCREIDLLTVKGKKQPARIYEIIQSRDSASGKLIELCSSFEKALGHYRAQEWAKAAKLFAKLRDEMGDEASATFLQRIELFKANPPPKDWDGVFVMKVK
ncbi:MAG TPA: adenylate/guanylate cyclase domain-containing protein [Spirochaetales bacterium]|nr:adenylate/guanylate cyclase domain-containing protein [Spirochaetales bacterium]HRY53519.1 adenylate/guanylate cyclase domain-containing protein [Spirochaetia bacterium]HRZ63797.1 adenylate/guanylate cyclase domain-containing protein [Spirochaetia bacterium]